MIVKFFLDFLVKYLKMFLSQNDWVLKEISFLYTAEVLHTLDYKTLLRKAYPKSAMSPFHSDGSL